MRLINALMVVLVISIAGCTGNGEGTDGADSNQVQSDTLTTKEKALDDRKRVIEENAKKKEEEAKEKKLNTEVDVTSIYTYLRTSPDYMYMSKLIFKSSYSKMLHNENLTFFACPDSIMMRKYTEDQVMALTGKNRQKDLDKLLENHIIPRRISAHKLQKATEVVTLGGRILEISKANTALTVNGLKAELHDYQTNMGIVVKIEGLIDFPE
jgi:uncharacterized surface protein with fasciclin (FAS1) repeats